MINLINISYRLKYVPKLWKTIEVIMISKPGKLLNEIKSYRLITHNVKTILKKPLLKRIKPIIERIEIIPTNQFGFRDKYSTIDQVHRIIDIIEKALEEKKICSAIFLDVAQVFNKL